VISELIATSFQGPLEIDRMLSPGGSGGSDTLEAFLCRAVTSIRPAHQVQFKPALNAHRSASVRGAARASSRLWHGLEQTALSGARRPEKGDRVAQRIMGGTARVKKYPSM
jgi:hypothetical protein